MEWVALGSLNWSTYGYLLVQLLVAMLPRDRHGLTSCFHTNSIPNAEGNYMATRVLCNPTGRKAYFRTESKKRQQTEEWQTEFRVDGWIMDAREWAGGSLSRIVGMPSHWLIGNCKHTKRKERSKGAVGMMDSSLHTMQAVFCWSRSRCKTQQQKNNNQQWWSH